MKAYLNVPQNVLIYESEHYITGRGTVVCVYSDHPESVNVGDTVAYKGTVFEISGIESFRKLIFPEKIPNNLGLILNREVTDVVPKFLIRDNLTDS